MDDANGLCVGCLRTISEITHWWMMNSCQRREVARLIESRRAKSGSSVR